MRVLLVSLLGLCVTPWVSAITYRDLELGSIVIDDDPQEIVEFEEESTTQVPEQDSNCTFEGGQGVCKKFEDCFPYLADFNSEFFEKGELYELAKASAPECPGENGFVCCPVYGYNGIPTRKPQFAGQTTTPSPPLPNNSTKKVSTPCGANLYEATTVVGGRYAQKGEFPYTVSLQNNGHHKCGGSLISDQWILTAAHCIADMRTFSTMKIHLGDHNVRDPSDVPHESRGVKRGYFHKDFSFNHLQNDVALLQLDRSVSFTQSVQPVCLTSTAPNEMNSDAVLSGWGKTGQHKPPSPILKTVTMPLIPHETCKKIYASDPRAPKVTTNMVCAGGRQPNDLKDACNGDSGGPLTIHEGDKAVQIGIVSWGLGCGEKPGVYTRVDKYRPWVDKNSQRS